MTRGKETAVFSLPPSFLPLYESVRIKGTRTGLTHEVQRARERERESSSSGKRGLSVLVFLFTMLKTRKRTNPGGSQQNPSKPQQQATATTGPSRVPPLRPLSLSFVPPPLLSHPGASFCVFNSHVLGSTLDRESLLSVSLSLSLLLRRFACFLSCFAVCAVPSFHVLRYSAKRFLSYRRGERMGLEDKKRHFTKGETK